MTTEHTKTPIPKIESQDQFMIELANKNCKDLEDIRVKIKDFGDTFNANIEKIKESISQNKCECSSSKKRKKTEESVDKIKKEKKRNISNIPPIKQVPCPYCKSQETTAFLYSQIKREWIYACREPKMFGQSGIYCGNIWIESDKSLAYCCECGNPHSDLDIRYQQPGYCCTKCGKFKVF